MTECRRLIAVEVVVGFGVGGQRWMGTLYPAQLGCEPKTALTKFINPLKKKKKRWGRSCHCGSGQGFNPWPHLVG